VSSTFFDVSGVRDSMAKSAFECNKENLYIAVDVAAGGESSAACFCQGSNLLLFLEYTSATLTATCKWIEKPIRFHCPRRIYVDSGGLGLGRS
jgi:hypothetical protein